MELANRSQASRALLAVCLLATVALAAPDTSTYERAVVRVVAASASAGDLAVASGSGFFINDRLVVTNQHVVAGAGPASDQPELFIVPSGGEEPLPVSVLWSDETLDLALLEYGGGAPHGALALGNGDLRAGSVVYAVGYPGPADAVVQGPSQSTLTDGILSRLPFEARWGTVGSGLALVLQHTADINPGNSGGPLLDACGGVLGVNTGGGVSNVRDADGNVVGATTAQGIFFALHVSELIPVLDDIGARYDEAAMCDGGTSFPAETVSTAAPHPLTIALLASILLGVTVLLFRRPRQAVAAGAGRSVAALADAVGAASVRRTAPDGTVKFSGRDGAPDLALHADVLRHARHGISIGRHPSLVDRPLQVEGLSRRHFRVSAHRGRLFVEDLNSTNGTFVNETRLRPYHGRQLRTGDVVSAGDGRWRFAGSD